MILITIITGVCKPTYNIWGPHIVVIRWFMRVWLMNNTTVGFLWILVDMTSLESIFYHLIIHILAVHLTWLFLHTRFKHQSEFASSKAPSFSEFLDHFQVPSSDRNKRSEMAHTFCTEKVMGVHWKMEARHVGGFLPIADQTIRMTPTWEGNVMMIAWLGISAWELELNWSVLCLGLFQDLFSND